MLFLCRFGVSDIRNDNIIIADGSNKAGIFGVGVARIIAGKRLEVVRRRLA